MRITPQQLDTLSDCLIGTCLSLDEALSMCGIEETEHNEAEAALEQDHNCAQCQQCGWGYRIEDLAPKNDVDDGGVCDDCVEE